MTDRLPFKMAAPLLPEIPYLPDGEMHHIVIQFQNGVCVLCIIDGNYYDPSGVTATPPATPEAPP